MIPKNYLSKGLYEDFFFIKGQNLDNLCTVFQKCRVNGVKETKLSEKKIMGAFASKICEKLRSFRYESSEDFFSLT